MYFLIQYWGIVPFVATPLKVVSSHFHSSFSPISSGTNCLTMRGNHLTQYNLTYQTPISKYDESPLKGRCHERDYTPILFF